MYYHRCLKARRCMCKEGRKRKRKDSHSTPGTGRVPRDQTHSRFTLLPDLVALKVPPFPVTSDVRELTPG
jgi:hypothetical protein